MGIQHVAAVGLLDPQMVALQVDLLTAQHLGPLVVAGVLRSIAPARDDGAARHRVDRATVDQVVGINAVVGLALFQHLPVVVVDAAQNAQILGAGLRAAASGMDDGDDPLARFEVVGVDRKFDGLGRCRTHACEHNGGQHNTQVQTI